MFEIKRNIIETDLPVIVSNYKVLLFDEMPILFAGTNLYGNRILASIIDEDFTNKVTRFLYSIVDEKNYINFISGKITYFEILNIVKNKFFVDETFAGDIFVFPISYDDIPVKYLPSEDSFCPEAENELSLNFGVSLKGKRQMFIKRKLLI